MEKKKRNRKEKGNYEWKTENRMKLHQTTKRYLVLTYLSQMHITRSVMCYYTLHITRVQFMYV
jgi:hypothetical protein